jgi:hypothetical protein
MARPKSKGAYVPLAAQYFMDDAILEAGPDAELLFVRCLSFLASVSSNGFITDRQVRSVVGLGLRNVPKRLTTLQEVGLLEATEGGFVVRSWTKWNKTAEEIGKLLAKDRERKARKDAELEANSARNPTGNGTDSSAQSSTEQNSTEQSNLPTEGVAAARGGDALFAEFYMAYPRKVGKEAARKKFLLLIKKTDAQVIVDGARRFGTDPNLPDDKNFIPHPATWLNQGRWEDEPLPARGDRPQHPVAPGEEWMLR